MQTSFMLHCIAWQAGGALFLDVRVAACAVRKAAVSLLKPHRDKVHR